MSRRRAARLVVLCIFVAALLGAPTGALGAVVVKHHLAFSFDGADAPEGPFQYVFSVADDASGGPSDGDVYVGEMKGEGEELVGRVLKFDEDGRYTGVEIDGSNTPGGGITFLGSESNFASDAIAVAGAPGPGHGDVYVVDLAHNVVNRFDEAGNYICQISGQATPSPSECNWPTGSATPQGGFVPTGVEVDETTGTIYVSDFAHDVVDEFDPSGGYLGQITDPHLQEPSSLNLDSSGRLYVANGALLGSESVLQFDPGGQFVRVFDSASPTAITVDRATDEVYLVHFENEETRITSYDADGNALETLKSPGSFYLSLYVNHLTGRMYGGHLDFFGSPSRVDAFNPDAVEPDVHVEADTAVGETTATVKGEVEPAGGTEATLCRFEYGKDGFEESAPCTPPPPYSSPTGVTAELSGLEPSTTYRFRLAAGNSPAGPYPEQIPAHSEESSFTTVGHPTVAEETADEVERSAASLHAKINPHGFDSKFRFEYVDDRHFEEEGFSGLATRSTSFSEIGKGVDPLTVSQSIHGLEIGTTYHFRAVAVNQRGEGRGAGASFVTLPVAQVERQWAYAHVTSALVEGEISGFGLDTTCEVQFVDEAGFERQGFAGAASVPCAKSPVTGPGASVVSAELLGLRTDTTYHFRFVAANESGAIAGSDETFETFGFESFSVEVIDEDGNPFTQAGGHPYARVLSYRFNHTFVPSAGGSSPSLDAFVRDVITEQPPGQTGVKEEELKKCPGHLAEEQRCPPDTQIGTLTIEYLEGNISTTTRALYDVVAPDGVATRYATLDPYTASDSSVRTDSDYGVTSSGLNLSQEARVVGLTIVVWGIPAEHLTGGNRSAILRTPTACSGPQTARVRVNTWEAPGDWVAASTQIPPTTGCDRLEFHPSIEWQPTSTVADSPTGLRVDVHQEQRTAPDELAYSDLEGVAMLPSKGLVFNPSGADGLAGCTAAEIAIRQKTAARCPEASKIGTMEIDTPLVDHPLRGGIYMATPFDNQFGSMFAIYLAVDDPRTGVVVKLAGEINPDAEDGQLSARFTENPQMPVEDFKLNFFGGPRAVLRTPATCGTFVTNSTITPWSAPQSGPPAHPTDSYRITSAPNGGNCIAREDEAPNRPAFRAGTAVPAAGSYSPYVFRLDREDGSQQFAGLSVSPPPGLLAKLAGIPRCASGAIEAARRLSAAEARAHPPCPDGSRVGTVLVSAGAGASPYHLSGQVYVGGPYKNAEVSLAVVVPVQAGPFDLGTVVVRAPLTVDLESGRVGVESDPIPTILKGVPLDVRSIEVRLDRPSFTVNPTNCKRGETLATVTTKAGARTQLSSPFRAGRCSRLAFAPKVGLRLMGSFRRRGHPALRAVIGLPRDNANISSVAVAMPATEFLDNSHIRGVCTRPQFLAETCPRDSVYGHAKAWSPLLDEPLSGPVYLRSSASGLPDLAADLDGEFRLAVAGQIDSSRGGIGASIKGLPDVPVSKFVMTTLGRDRGLLVNSVDVCRHPGRGTLRMEAQNGKVVVLHPPLTATCRGDGDQGARRQDRPHRR